MYTGDYYDRKHLRRLIFGWAGVLYTRFCRRKRTAYCRNRHHSNEHVKKRNNSNTQLARDNTAVIARRRVPTTHVNILFSIYYFQLHIVALSSSAYKYMRAIIVMIIVITTGNNVEKKTYWKRRRRLRNKIKYSTWRRRRRRDAVLPSRVSENRPILCRQCNSSSHADKF